MRVGISGSSGLIGSALASALGARGDSVVRLVRSGGGTDTEALWNPGMGLVETGPVEGLDALVHLAGVGIADKRWSAKRKKAIFSSRVDGTRRLVATCAELEQPPRQFLGGSAVGFYGSCSDQTLDETSRAGTGFLANLCQAWEKEAAAAEPWADRVYHLRTGIVLSTRGGALAKMLPPFRLGLGGILGSGAQYMSWISIDDEVAAILHLLDSDLASGPVNLTAPTPATNRELTKALGRALRRPTIFPLPAIMVTTLFGEMGREALLGSQRVLPRRLEGSGFQFAHSSLEAALERVLSA